MKRFLALSVLLMTTPAAARDLSKTEIKRVAVQGSVHMLVGAGGNIGVSVGKDGVLIVDDQFQELSKKIIAAVAKIERGPLRYVLNTHWHGDHTGGNVAMAEHGATIIAHDNVRARLLVGRPKGARIVPPAPQAALPVITFDATLTLHFNGESIVAIHLPHGHTDGDAAVYFKGSNVVHMGDSYFQIGFPYVDLSSGGSVDGFLANLARVLAVVPEDAKVIPGHGELSTHAEMKAHLAALTKTRDLVVAGMRAGKSKTALVKAGLPAEFAPLSWRFISTGKWIETIYDSTKAAKKDDQR